MIEGGGNNMPNQDGRGQSQIGSDICKCPKCGYTVDHERGKPCSQSKCPKCQTEMQGVNCQDE